MTDDKENNIHLELAQSRQCHSNFCSVFINSFCTTSAVVSLTMRLQSKSCEAALKNLNRIFFSASGHCQTGICQADDCFVGIDHAGQLILLCSCLSESNLLEFKSQPNSVRCRQRKKLPKEYTIEMLC